MDDLPLNRLASGVSTVPLSFVPVTVASEPEGPVQLLRSQSAPKTPYGRSITMDTEEEQDEAGALADTAEELLEDMMICTFSTLKSRQDADAPQLSRSSTGIEVRERTERGPVTPHASSGGPPGQTQKPNYGPALSSSSPGSGRRLAKASSGRASEEQASALRRLATRSILKRNTSSVGSASAVSVSGPSTGIKSFVEAVQAVRAVERFKQTFSYKTSPSEYDPTWPEIIEEECPQLRWMMILGGYWDQGQFAHRPWGQRLYRLHTGAMQLVMALAPLFHLLTIIFAYPISRVHQLDNVPHMRFEYSIYLIITAVIWRCSHFISCQYTVHGSLGEFIEDLSSLQQKFHIPWHKMRQSCILSFAMSGLMGCILVYRNLWSFLEVLAKWSEADDTWSQAAMAVLAASNAMYMGYAPCFVGRGLFVFVSFGFMGHLHAMDLLRFSQHARAILDEAAVAPEVPATSTPASDPLSPPSAPPPRAGRLGPSPSRLQSSMVVDRLGLEGACIAARLKATNETWAAVFAMMILAMSMTPIALAMYLSKGFKDAADRGEMEAYVASVGQFDVPLLLCQLYALYWMMSGLAVVADCSEDICRYALNHPRFLRLSTDHLGDPFAIVGYVRGLELAIRVMHFPLSSLTCLNLMAGIVLAFALMAFQLYLGVEV